MSEFTICCLFINIMGLIKINIIFFFTFTYLTINMCNPWVSLIDNNLSQRCSWYLEAYLHIDFFKTFYLNLLSILAFNIFSQLKLYDFFFKILSLDVMPNKISRKLFFWRIAMLWGNRSHQNIWFDCWTNSKIGHLLPILDLVWLSASKINAIFWCFVFLI